MMNSRFLKIVCAASAGLLMVLSLGGCMKDGNDGLSAYEIAVKNGSTNAKSESEWLASLRGEDGKDGKNGEDGMSAYELACSLGYSGTPEGWLESLRGPEGPGGKSAYEIAVDNGYTGTEAEWVKELMGSREESGTGTGVGISTVTVNAAKHLIVRLTNGTTIDAGYIGVSTDDTPTAPKVDADGYTVVNQRVRIIAGALNIRRTPDSSVSDNIIVYLNEGSELVRVGIGNGNVTWSKVIYNGEVCYASSKYLEVVESSPSEVDLSGVEMPKVNLMDSYTLLVGKQMCFEAGQFAVGLSDGMYTTFKYSGSGKKVITPRSIAITPTAAGEETLVVSIKKYVGGVPAVIFSKTVKLNVVQASSVSLRGLIIGDSRISDGTLVDTLKSNFGSSLTLIGTKKTGSGNLHEGRGAWSTSNYLSYATVSGAANPFYNPAKNSFDFGYYLTQNSFAAPDFVLFNLGANDAYSSRSIANYEEMIKSIKEYNASASKAVKVLIMTEYLSPADGFAVSDAYDPVARREEQFEYFTKLCRAFGGRESEGIYVIPNYIVVNDTDDRILGSAQSSVYGTPTSGVITDAVHLSAAGYKKEADVVSAYICSIFH